MQITIFLITLLLSIGLHGKKEITSYGTQVSEYGITHSFLICGNKTVLLNEKSEILWQTKGYGRDGFVLENGNILVSGG
jgi:hypothetical protein